ncbi:ABC transporter permease [Ensifer adhaerens]|uniref:ABC transporter permease n=2 Tax=Ensifer adhaerens TaxID=106592 RepID=A0A0L8BY53_ENSAD|nr:ABC transporter permease [Ensifer adhaerens]
MMETISNVIGFLPALIKATPLTLLLTAVAGVFGLAIGTLVALARLSTRRILSMPAYVFTFAFRGTPLLVQIYLVYYGLGQVLPGTWVRHSFLWPYLRDGLWYAIFALSLNQAAYNAEVIRGAIKAIPGGQIEAAKSIGMRSSLILRRITLPQALRSCLPVLTGDLIILLKTTSLASTITILEVMGTARMLQRQSLLIFEPLIAAGIIYFTVVFILTRVMNVVEKRLTRYRTAKA